jgi:hypothetical protein
MDQDSRRSGGNSPTRHCQPWIAVASVLAILATAQGCDNWRQPPMSTGSLADPSCRIDATACKAVFSDGTLVSLSIEQSPPRPLEPLDFHARVTGMVPRKVTVELAGITMNMGPNRIALKSAGNGLFQGQGMVPVCIRDRMEWQAIVRMETRGGVYEVPFHFHVSRH